MPIRRWLAIGTAAIWLVSLAVEVPFAAAQKGGRSYSSGSRSSSSSSSRSSGSSSSSSRSYSRPSTNTGRSGWSGSSSKTSSSSSNRVFPTGKTGWTSSSGTTTTQSPGINRPSESGRTATGKKPTGSFDSAAGRAQRKEESRANYNQSNPQRVQIPSTTNPANRTPPPSSNPNTWQTDPRDRQIDELKRQLDRERWNNWDTRQRDFFGGYWNRPVVVYRDNYSSFFWWWLLDQSLDTRARWAYTHRYAMDDSRYREMVTKDAQLEARIRELENQKVPRDPSWTPPGVDHDLVYKKEYVDEARKKPDPPEETGPGTFPGLGGVPGPRPAATSGGPGIMSFFVTIAIVAFLIWLVFFKRWGN